MQKKNTPEDRVVARGREYASPVSFGIYPNEKGEPDLGYKPGGFTKREVIAKDILSAMISNSSVRLTLSGDEINADMRRLASNAAKMADALLIELSKGE